MAKKDPLFILDGVRTPIATPAKSLKHYTAAGLGGVVVDGLIKKNEIDPATIDEVILGNAVAAGTGQNLARQAAMAGGLPAHIPAVTVNHVCGGGLYSVILAARGILSGEAQCVLAGGAESATHAPLLQFESNDAKLNQVPTTSLIHDGLFCRLSNKRMGQLADDLANQYKISRHNQDVYSLESHQKACRAQEQGKFSPEIVPVLQKQDVFFSQDERPRRKISLTRLADLSPVFEKQGTVSPGNSSAPSDGAAVLIAASEPFLKKNRLKPRARILSYTSIFVDPKDVFTSAIPSIQGCLKRGSLQMKDIDLWEIGEAFAAQAIYTRSELKIPDEKMNVWGGDIALGHPLGAAGARILVTLISALKDRKKSKGVACVCLGGGGAVSVAIEMLN